MADPGKDDPTGVTGPQTPKNPNADEIDENVEERGGGPVGVEVPQKQDDAGKPSQE
jgi:hypothetical protein